MDRKLVGLMAIFFIIFGLFISFMVFEKPITQFTRAKEESIVSAGNSLLTAWPLSLAANGNDASIITIFVRNDQGGGISGKTVAVSSSVGNIQTIEGVSDTAGKTIFKLTSTDVGTADIKAIVGGTTVLTQTLSIVFTNP